MRLAAIRLCMGEPPAMANISPSKYSLLNGAARSRARYSDSVNRGTVVGTAITLEILVRPSPEASAHCRATLRGLQRALAAGADEVKEILLGIPRIRTEVCPNEPAQPLRRRPALREVKLADRLAHPNVDRECLLKAIGEQENAIGNLLADSRQADQRRAGFGGRAGLEAA